MQAKLIENLNREIKLMNDEFEIELVKIAKAIERNEIENLWSSLSPVEPEFIGFKSLPEWKNAPLM